MPTNVAVTDLADCIVTTQREPEAASHPRQPRNTLPSFAAAERVTTVLQSYAAEQTAPQLISVALGGLEAEVTVPFPMPPLVTLSMNCWSAKVAVTHFAASIVTVQVAPETASHPAHPTSSDPTSACAVSVTTVPAA
jgi:hypothetical protein